MVITYRNIRTGVEYPVFLLPSGNWELHDGLLFLEDKIVDDRNKEENLLCTKRHALHN